MARISGVDLPREKRVEIGLTYIYGIGLPSSQRILKEANVNPDTRCADLTDDEVRRLSEVIKATQVVEGDLRREIGFNIKRLQEIACYRGKRHRQGLPVRRQNTWRCTSGSEAMACCNKACTSSPSKYSSAMSIFATPLSSSVYMLAVSFCLRTKVRHSLMAMRCSHVENLERP